MTDIRRRLRELKEPAYTGVEYEKTDNRQRGVEEVVKKMEGMQGVQEETTTSAWRTGMEGYMLYDKSFGTDSCIAETTTRDVID